MMTIDLRQQQVSLDELLAAVDSGSVLVIRPDGTRVTLELADDFDQEVAMLGQSERFMAFLHERAQETGGQSLEDFERRLRDREADSSNTP
jgi:hypothetical protein